MSKTKEQLKKEFFDEVNDFMQNIQDKYESIAEDIGFIGTVVILNDNDQIDCAISAFGVEDAIIEASYNLMQSEELKDVFITASMEIALEESRQLKPSINDINVN